MIKKILSSAILSIFLEKSAKKSFIALRKNRKLQNDSASIPSAIASKAPLKSGTDAQTTDVRREEIIRNALEAHKKNSNVLDDLSEDQRKRLQQLAMQTMLGKSVKKNEEQNKFTKKLAAVDTKAPAASSALAHSPSTKRQTLINNAIAAHKKYSKVLDDLSVDQKRKLQSLAMEIMFGEINK